MRHFLLNFPLFSFILLAPAFMVGHTFAQNEQEPNSPPPPKVFQPGETQHGFSEFDSLPETYQEESPSKPSDHSTGMIGIGPNDPNQKPSGLFYKIDFAESFEEEQGIRRGHGVMAINPRTEFSPDTRSIYLVFSLFKHYAPYQVFGRLYPENVDHQDPSTLLDEDTMYIAAEDESGYLQFFPRSGRWTPGTYQVKIYVGWETNEVNQMGTMRFTVTPTPSSFPKSSE